jgi:hypothetical protein
VFGLAGSLTTCQPLSFKLTSIPASSGVLNITAINMFGLVNENLDIKSFRKTLILIFRYALLDQLLG